MKKLAWLVWVSLFLVAACAPVSHDSAPIPASVTPSATLPFTPALFSTPIALSPQPAVTTQPTVAFDRSPAATCEVVSLVSAGVTGDFILPPEEQADWSYGSPSPAVTIISYCQYQLPACRVLTNSLAELQQRYPDEVRVVLRQYPQPQTYDKSLLAAYAAEAAGIENDFWGMNELLYSRQPDWINLPADAFMDWVMKESPGYHIDAEQLKVNMENPAVMTRVKQVIEDATPLAISTTPVLFMNNLRVKTRLNAESMAEQVEYFLLQKTAFTECPANTIDPQKIYLATFHTEKGNIVFELFPQVAPMAVNSFVFLARKGWYDNSTFFRVIPGYVVQGGDPSGSGLGGPGYVFSNEVDPQLRFNTPGLLGLTHTSGGMNGSQFFITYTALPELDGQFTIIGRVIEGGNVLNALRPRNPESDVILLPADRLLQVTIEEIE